MRSAQMIRRVLLIVGAPCGGVSLLADGLRALVADASVAGQAARREQDQFVRCNDRLFEAMGKRWESVALPPWPDVAVPSGSALAQAMAELARGGDGAGTALLADHRASRLLPAWQSAFAPAEIEDSYLIVLRDPASVARSLLTRHGLRPEKSYLLWFAQLFSATQDSAGKPRVVIDFDAFLRAPRQQLERAAAMLALAGANTQGNTFSRFCAGLAAPPATAVDAAAAVAATLADPRAGALVANAYALLGELAGEGQDAHADGSHFEQAWQSLAESLQQMSPLLRYLDICESKIDVMALFHGEATEQIAVAAPAPPAPAPALATAAGTPARVQAVGPSSVSVVIPLYNHQQYIEAALDSVLAQTHRPTEIIVIDDGSNDASAVKVLAYCRDHPEIIFWSWPNQGAHHTLNAAIHRATGSYVAILNSDDCYHPQRLATCLAAMEEHPDLAAVATGVRFIDAEGRQLASPWYADAVAYYREHGDLALALFRANFLVSTSNLFVRRSLFETAGYFAPLRYTHDLEFFLRLIADGRSVLLLDAPLLSYRMHPRNTIGESQASLDLELGAIFAYHLYRRQLAERGHPPGQSALDRYVEVLGKHKLLGPVEYFLALLERSGEHGSPPAGGPEAQLRALLTKMGVVPSARGGAESMLSRFVAARSAYLRRWERVSSDAKVLAAFAEQKNTIEEMRGSLEQMRSSFAQQAGSIDDLRAQIARAGEMLADKVRSLGLQAQEIARLNAAVAAKELAVAEQAAEIRRLEAEFAAKNQAMAAQSEVLRSLGDQLAALKRSHWYRLGVTLRQEPFGLRKLLKTAYHAGACAVPERWRPALRPLLERLRRYADRRRYAAAAVAPQPVRSASPADSGKPRVVHVIANFMLGGSSRLVADLIEGLGSEFSQRVVTSFLPSPPAYSGVDVTEFRSPQSPEDLLPFLRDCSPALVHVHYWGDVDWPWYDILFRAVAGLGCPVLENVNTPVAPYRAACVRRYVHVSTYVRDHFGDGTADNLVIYPGSDFSKFTRKEDAELPADCIGMVYRLEPDKLNEQAIEVFIKVVRRRPRTRAIIVGGGSYLEPYRRAVQAAGLADSFEFTGYADYDALPALYQRFSLFVAPVWKESFGQVGPFAMNMGIPVVGYRVGGLEEIVDDPSLLAPPGDADELAALIVALLDDPQRCREIGRHNLARARALFSVEAMVDAYRRLYRELLGAAR